MNISIQIYCLSKSYWVRSNRSQLLPPSMDMRWIGMTYTIGMITTYSVESGKGKMYTDSITIS